MKNKDSEKFEIRDLRGKTKFFVDDLYLNGYAKKCGIYSTGVYLSLCRHSNKEQFCWPSQRKIAEELKISSRQVGRAIKILEKFNIIKKIRVGKKLNNRYLLLDKSEWADSPIKKDQQSNHTATDSLVHSKETNLRIKNKKEDSSKKPYFWNKSMWRDENKKWWVIHGQNDFREFAGKESDIEWK